MVYVYRKKFGSWQLEQILTAGDGTADDQFGQSVEVRGEMIIVGASGAANGNDVKSGAVYLFHRVAGTWEETAKIYADDGQDGDQFGFSVDISSGVIGVGARWADVEEAVDAGAAYLFRKAEGDWTQIGKLTASNAAEGDEFGHSLAMTGPLVAVGANLTDVDGRVDQGTVYLFSVRGTDGRKSINSMLRAVCPATGTVRPWRRTATSWWSGHGPPTLTSRIKARHIPTCPGNPNMLRIR